MSTSLRKLALKMQPWLILLLAFQGQPGESASVLLKAILGQPA